MHTIIHSPTPNRRSPAMPEPFQPEYRQPNYDCRELPEALKLTVYVPGVNPASIEIEVCGPDIIITARKPHVVRVNWQALNLESAQRDYRLHLRLGLGLDYSSLTAELQNGVLTISLPKRQPASPDGRLRDVA